MLMLKSYFAQYQFEVSFRVEGKLEYQPDQPIEQFFNKETQTGTLTFIDKLPAALEKSDEAAFKTQARTKATASLTRCLKAWITPESFAGSYRLVITECKATRIEKK